MDEHYSLCSHALNNMTLNDLAHVYADLKMENIKLNANLASALTALNKIYSYRSDEPDWHMVMAIAGDIVNVMEWVESKQQIARDAINAQGDTKK